MSSFKHPVGSEPSRVYWRRRAAVIVAVVLIILLIVVISKAAGAGSEASPVSSPSTSSPAVAAPVAPVATATSAPSGSGSSAASSAASGSAAAPATPAANGTCTAGEITLKPLADKSSYTSLQQPQISMSITNSSTSACTIDLGSSQQVLTITSGAETYWSSKDCQVNGTHQNVKIAAGQTLTTPAIAWDRTRSSASTCSSARSSVPAAGASYHLKVSVGTITSSTSALMVLR